MGTQSRHGGFRVRAAVNSFILLYTDRAATLPPHPDWAIRAHETMEECQAVDCSLEENRQLLLARWGSRGGSPTTGHVSRWWESTCLPRRTLGSIVLGELTILSAGGGHAPLLRLSGASSRMGSWSSLYALRPEAQHAEGRRWAPGESMPSRSPYRPTAGGAIRSGPPPPTW